MLDYRDVISAWVFYAVIVFAMFAFSIVHESVATRPAALVGSPVVAPVESAGLHSLSEGRTVEYELVPSRDGKFEAVVD